MQILDTIGQGFNDAVSRLFNTATDLAEAKLEAAKDTKEKTPAKPATASITDMIKKNWIVLAVIGLAAYLLMRRR